MSEELDISYLLQVAQNPDVATRLELARQMASFFQDPDANPQDRVSLTPVLMELANDSVVTVRQSLAGGLAHTPHAPQSIVRTLVCDTDEICLPLLRHTPALPESDLKAVVASGKLSRQMAVASRTGITPVLGRMIIETRSTDLCLRLLNNPEFQPDSRFLERVLELHADDADIIEALSDRPNVPLHIRVLLISSASHNLSSVQSLKGWLEKGQEESVLGGVKEQAIVRLMCDTPTDADDIRLTVKALHKVNALTASLIMRATVAGLIHFVEAALQALTGIPEKRIRTLLRGRARLGSRAVYMRAGLPLGAYRIFRFALDIFEQRDCVLTGVSAEQFGKLVVERVVTDADDLPITERRALLELLAKLAGDEARGIAKQLYENMPVAA